jgi:hypothetical protein
VVRQADADTQLRSIAAHDDQLTEFPLLQGKQPHRVHFCGPTPEQKKKKVKPAYFSFRFAFFEPFMALDDFFALGLSEEPALTFDFTIVNSVLIWNLAAAFQLPVSIVHPDSDSIF